MDDDVICPKLQPDEEAILHDSMNFARDETPSAVLIGDEKVDVNSKGKTKTCYDESSQNQDAPTSDPGKSSTLGSLISNDLNSSNSELSCHNDDNDDDDGDVDDYADDDYDYDDNYVYEDDYVIMQSQFDNVDLPPGVEAMVPWLKEPASSPYITSTTSSSNISDLSESNRKAAVPDLTESKRRAAVADLDESKIKAASSSHSTILGESSSVGKEENGEISVMSCFPLFKRFDTVDDFSDHHYSGVGFVGEQPPKNWAKKIQEEWKILEKSLPDTIFVRVCEARMELLRAVMIGPSGTPYHDGLFVFDCLFPSSYPNEPPRVYYYSGGLRLNPNLYECGKVCLSLLGTWSGKSNEMWDKKNSTMLQVLVSIQALILNERPFFNEPGYEKSYVGEEGERRSRSYNEDTFILSLKTMMYTLRKPPKHFEDLVTDHFRNRAHDILVACKAYMDGAVVGHVVVREGTPEIGQADGVHSLEFKTKLGQMMNILVTSFTRNGSTDVSRFVLQAEDNRSKR